MQLVCVSTFHFDIKRHVSKQADPFDKHLSSASLSSALGNIHMFPIGLIHLLLYYYVPFATASKAEYRLYR